MVARYLYEDSFGLMHFLRGTLGTLGTTVLELLLDA